MLVQTRIATARKALASSLDGLAPGSFAWLRQVRSWLETVALEVARPARKILRASVGVRLFLAHAIESVPASIAAARELHAMALASSFTGPQAFARAISDHAYALAVFHDDELTCNLCNNRLELWSRYEQAVWLCGFVHGSDIDQSTLSPASRALVIRAGRKRQLAEPA